MLLLKALHLVVRAFLVIACAFWLLILLELTPGLVYGGMDGVQGKLLHIWSMGRLEIDSGCPDAVRLIHEGYTDIILFLLLTWAAVELKRFLSRRMLQTARSPQIPAATR